MKIFGNRLKRKGDKLIFTELQFPGSCCPFCIKGSSNGITQRYWRKWGVCLLNLSVILISSPALNLLFHQELAAGSRTVPSAHIPNTNPRPIDLWSLVRKQLTDPDLNRTNTNKRCCWGKMYILPSLTERQDKSFLSCFYCYCLKEWKTQR